MHRHNPDAHQTFSVRSCRDPGRNGPPTATEETGPTTRHTVAFEKCRGVVGQLVRLRSVLSIGKLAGSPEAGRYYTDAVAKGREDYYQGSGEAPGAWSGAGAQLLELDGRVDDDAFATVLGGVDPKSGDPLRSSRGPSRVAGFDLTFSAPKSVSVLFGLADEDTVRAVRRAHDHAVNQALGYVEREATFTRRGTNGREILRG